MTDINVCVQQQLVYSRYSSMLSRLLPLRFLSEKFGSPEVCDEALPDNDEGHQTNNDKDGSR